MASWIKRKGVKSSEKAHYGVACGAHVGAVDVVWGVALAGTPFHGCKHGSQGKQASHGKCHHHEGGGNGGGGDGGDDDDDDDDDDD